MRKSRFILVVLFLLSSFLKAQEVQFGLKGGLSYSSVIGDLTDGLKFRLSGHAGVFVELEFSENFSFKPEILYSSQGFQFSSDLATIQNGGVVSDENDFRTNVQYNYLAVPILGKFYLNDKVALEFGPQFAFLLNQVSKIKNLDQGDDSIPENKSTVSGNFQLDYGGAVGLDIKFAENISIAPRFYIGLRNRLNGIGAPLQNFNAAIQLSANYSF